VEKSIVENNQVHLLGGVSFVVVVKLLVDKLADRIKVRNGFINEGGLLCQFTILIKDILTLEISEEEVSHEHIIIKAL
jgi:hypothetical protein